MHHRGAGTNAKVARCALAFKAHQDEVPFLHFCQRHADQNAGIDVVLQRFLDLAAGRHPRIASTVARFDANFAGYMDQQPGAV